MATTKTILFGFGQRALQLPKALLNWLLTIQALLPLNLVDTTDAPYGEETPPAGNDIATGQSNQNQELIYKKISADANGFTLTGSAEGPFPEGPITLTAQYEILRIKSDGSTWWKVG